MGIGDLLIYKKNYFLLKNILSNYIKNKYLKSMRYILSIFLFSILIQNIITEQDILDRMARAAITFRNIVKYKQEQMRKLQDGTDTPNIVVTVPRDLPEATKKQAEETLKEEAQPTEKMPETPNIGNNSTKPSTYKDKLIQIRKFHKFNKPTNSTILNFGVFLYFLNRIIPKNVIMRVVIRYNSRRTLRGLDDIDAESVRTVCELKEGYEEYEGRVGNGTNVDYDCNAETSKKGEVGEAKIDTEKPMVVGTECINVSEIEFHPDSEKGAQNLASENSELHIGVLSIEGVKTSEQNLTLTGKVIPPTLPLTGPYSIDFYDTEREEMKTLNCQAYHVQNEADFTLVCDTSKNPLTTNYGNLTLLKIDTNELYASFNIPPDKNETTPIRAGGSGNNIYYRKNSSGLSGGAIAGIVIACVVVLAAASIAAIMLRKPSPPIDNTTVVGLKTVENI